MNNHDLDLEYMLLMDALQQEESDPKEENLQRLIDFIRFNKFITAVDENLLARFDLRPEDLTEEDKYRIQKCRG